MKKIFTLISSAIFGITALNAQVFQEDFQNGIPSNFVLIRNHNLTPAANVNFVTSAWVSRDNIVSTGNKAACSTSWFTPAGVADDWMIIPGITLTSGNYLVWKALAPDAAYNDGYEVKLSTSNGVTIPDFNINLFSITGENSDDWTTRSVDLSVYAGQTVSIAFRNNSNDKFLLYVDDIRVVQVSGNDLAGLSHTIKKYNATGSPISVQGVLENNGVPVTSMTLNYKVGNNAVVSQNLTSLSIGAFQTYNFTHSTPITASTPGAYNVKIWASNINGGADGLNSNDTITGSYFVGNGSQRVSLSEMFSSATCAPCASWNQNVYTPAFEDNNFNKAGSNRIALKFQVPIPTAGDPSRNADSDARRAYYNVNAAPTMILDGGELNYSGATWAAVATEYDAAVAQSVSEPAFATIIGSATATVTPSGKLNVEISGNVQNKVDFFANKSLTLHLVVASQAYTYSASPNGDTEYHHVARKMLPSPTGTAINNPAVNTDIAFSQSYEFTVGSVAQGNFNLWDDKIEVVAFLQDPTDNYIVQAGLLPVTLISNVSELPSSVKGMSLYPNPASESANLVFNLIENADVNVSVINALGQTVYVSESNNFTSGQNIITLPINNLSKGIYFVNVNVNGERATRKLIVE